MTANWLEGLTLERVDVGEVVLRVRYGGDGSPVLLLHGHPIASGHHIAEEAPEEVAAVTGFLRG